MSGADLLEELMRNDWTLEQMLMAHKLRAEAEVARLNELLTAKDEQIAVLVRILGRDPVIARLS